MQRGTRRGWRLRRLQERSEGWLLQRRSRAGGGGGGGGGGGVGFNVNPKQGGVAVGGRKYLLLQHRRVVRAAVLVLRRPKRGGGGRGGGLRGRDQAVEQRVRRGPARRQLRREDGPCVAAPPGRGLGRRGGGLLLRLLGGWGGRGVRGELAGRVVRREVEARRDRLQLLVAVVRQRRRRRGRRRGGGGCGGGCDGRVRFGFLLQPESGRGGEGKRETKRKGGGGKE